MSVLYTFCPCMSVLCLCFLIMCVTAIEYNFFGVYALYLYSIIGYLERRFYYYYYYSLRSTVLHCTTLHRTVHSRHVCLLLLFVMLLLISWGP